MVATDGMEDVSRAFEKGETQGFMKILVDSRASGFLGASILGLGRRRDHPFSSRPHVRQSALHSDAAGRAHPPDGIGVAADHVGDLKDLQQGREPIGQHHVAETAPPIRREPPSHGETARVRRAGDRAHRLPHGGRSVRHPGHPALAGSHYQVTPAAMGFAVNASTMGMAVAGFAVALLLPQASTAGLASSISLALLAIPTALLAMAPASAPSRCCASRRVSSWPRPLR